MSIRLILTHPGGAHKDDLLACSVLAALHQAPIERREPTQADLADPETCVIDVGEQHEPLKLNFDHHQFPKDHPPTCSLSLVLQHLGHYHDARQFCDWLEPAEWFDCRGSKDTASWLGVAPKVMDQLVSPIDVTLMRRFARHERLAPGEPLWEVLRMVGEDLIDYITTLRKRLDYIAENSEFWKLESGADSFEVLFVPRTNPLPPEPSLGLERFIESQARPGQVAAMVYPDRRGSGHGLSRYNDDPRLDFTRIAGCPDVHFAHARGFVAKTSAMDAGRLKELVLAAWVG